jgi:hypothetical protein
MMLLALAGDGQNAVLCRVCYSNFFLHPLVFYICATLLRPASATVMQLPRNILLSLYGLFLFAFFVSSQSTTESPSSAAVSTSSFLATESANLGGAGSGDTGGAAPDDSTMSSSFSTTVTTSSDTATPSNEVGGGGAGGAGSGDTGSNAAGNTSAPSTAGAILVKDSFGMPLSCVLHVLGILLTRRFQC